MSALEIDNLWEKPSLDITCIEYKRRDIEEELAAVICYYSVLLKQFILLKIDISKILSLTNDNLLKWL